MLTELLPPRSALFVPASNPKALAKIAGVGADMVIVELEDAVRPEDKDAARKAAIESLGGDFGGSIKALRINAFGTPWHVDDVEAAAGSGAELVVIPKVESPDAIAALATRIGRPLLAMIETPVGVLNAAPIAAASGVKGLIAGTNDIAHSMRLPADPERQGLMLPLQHIVLAARAAGGWALDGVYNSITDADGLAAECASGRRWGFDGKTLIHPAQVGPANQAYGPSAGEVEDARALLALVEESPHGIGALRFRDRMVEDMHVATARALVARADQQG